MSLPSILVMWPINLKSNPVNVTGTSILKAYGQALPIGFFETMGGVTSRLCGNSSPTLALSDICQRMRCLVACCGSEVHTDLRDASDEYEKEAPEEHEEEEQQPEELTFRETVL